LLNNKKISPDGIGLLLKIGALNNDASINDNNLIGDPTEAALIVSAAKAGIDNVSMQKKYPREGEIPFSSERKIMTTFHNIDGENMAYTKGAPEVILGMCTSIHENGRTIKLTEEKKKEILEANREFANGALRVLGFACKTVMDKARAEKALTFVGLQGMIDPARPEVGEAIKKCKKAGVMTSICGQAGSNPEMVKKLVRMGIDSVSANIDAVEKIRDSILLEEKKLILEKAHKK